MNFPQYSISSNQWSTGGLFLLTISCLIAASEFFRARLQWSVETNRKLVHVSVGLMITLSPLLFSTPLQPALLAVMFLVLNAVALKSKQFQAIHATARRTYGTVYFPLAFLILALGWWQRPLALMAGTLTMAFADTIAAMVGGRIKKPHSYRLWADTKSLEGSTAMFVAGFMGILSLALLFRPYLPLHLPSGLILGLAGFTALVATAAESISKDGSDNLSVPLMSAIAFDLYLIGAANGSLGALLRWTALSALILLLAYRLKTLSGSGGVAAFLIGIVIFGAGGIKWITPMIVFFILSSAISKIGKSRRSTPKMLTWKNYQKGSRRDLVQVLANGGIATLLALLNLYHPADWLYYMFLGAIAAATADTWATEIGFFNPGDPRHIITMRTVPKGTSGGISIVGTLGTLAGSALIGATGLIFGLDLRIALLITLAGLIASLIDSLLGGTVQSRYRCVVCGEITENHNHCEQPTKHYNGVLWIDNDMVNLLCTLSGAFMVVLL
ncbi:MAG: DUF92 domain-containing protein [Candidatus Neomarinimicrobiota bacterium]